MWLCRYRNVSTCEVSSSQAISSPQRSKRVKENTPPRCALVHSSPACSSSVTCGWGDGASSTTRERQRQTIVIPDTPSPTVSVITISSDTDEEEEQKHAPTSTVSKQRKNVISCVTVHDSPYSDSSSNTSPYSVQHRAGHNASTFDTKGSLENHCTGNPRTIIVPPLKTQASEVLVECDSLVPGNLGPAGGWVSVFCHEQFCDVSAGRCGAAVGFCSASLMSSIFGV